MRMPASGPWVVTRLRLASGFVFGTWSSSHRRVRRTWRTVGSLEPTPRAARPPPEHWCSQCGKI
eukprot:4909521-Prymnesium_polylepis.1